ncbi:hypothetical protein SDJN03_06315, partial [Cucurbita argyrosperma subsp. sororia]
MPTPSFELEIQEDQHLSIGANALRSDHGLTIRSPTGSGLSYSNPSLWLKSIFGLVYVYSELSLKIMA